MERQLISAEQHWAAIHLRWLYTVRHGAPTLKAIDPSHIGGYELRANDPEWYEQREKEFNDAMAVLSPNGHARLLLDVCIYNERPVFLKSNSKVKSLHTAAASAFITCLREGLDLLSDHWQHA